MQQHGHRKVGERGQITIPKAFREKFGIRGGDEVVISEQSGKLVIERPVTREDMAAGYRKHASRSSELAEELKGVSSEADDQLGDPPAW